VRAEIEASVLSPNRELRTVVAGSAQSLGKLNTLRVVGGRAREACVNPLRDSGLTSSGGIVPLMNVVGTDPGEA
jgi:hypothetical protein